MRLCVLSHRVCSAVPTTNFEIEDATETGAQSALRADFRAPKLPESRFRSSESFPKRSRTAPKCTPAHFCAPGISQTRLKSLRSEPGHGFPPLF